MWIRIRFLLLLIGKHLRILRGSSIFRALPNFTIDSSLISLRWLLQSVTCCQTIRNSGGYQSSNVPLTP